MLRSVGSWPSVSPQRDACRGRWLYAGWPERSPKERLPPGLAWVKICVKQENRGTLLLLLNIFWLRLSASTSDYFDVLRFVMALQAALTGCSGESKCHTNWAFSATLLLCLHPRSCSCIKSYCIYPILRWRYPRVHGMISNESHVCP